MKTGTSFGSARTEIFQLLFLLNVVCFLSMKFYIKKNFFFQFLRAENNSLWFLLLNNVLEIDPIEKVSPDSFFRSAWADIIS